MTDETRIPVIIGVGQVNDRPDDPGQGMDPVDLMETALRRADEDAGGGWLAKLDSIETVRQISFIDIRDPAPMLAERFGVSPKILSTTKSPSGDSPILLLNDAANRIGAGEIEVAAVVGAEALRTAAQLAAKQAGDDASSHNKTREVSSKAPPSYRGRYGLTAPVDVYPLYENAGRAAYGQTLAEAQAESGLIWSLFSNVAAAYHGAWLKKPLSAHEIITPSEKNRPIAFPYTKLQVANSSVNQGAGFLVASLAAAKAAGIPEERLIYVGKGAAAHEAEDPMDRTGYDRSFSMQVSLEKALELNGVTTADLDHAELYSCFPCVPKMARRVIGWPAEREATVFGGLTFGGGPIGNYMSHAVCGMVEKLRAEGTNGLLFANGGFATHNHTILLTRTPQPAGLFPQDYDYQAEADSRRTPLPPVDEDYEGPGTIETYTVLFGRTGAPKHGVVMARSPEGHRFLAKVPAEDEDIIEFLTDGQVEPVGTSGTGKKREDGTLIWQRTGS